MERKDEGEIENKPVMERERTKEIMRTCEWAVRQWLEKEKDIGKPRN